MMRAVACDLGGVLIPAPFDAFSALELRSGAAVGAVRAVNARNPDDNAWARLERREITVEGFTDLFTAEAHHLGHRLPAREVIDLVTGMSPAREFADEAMVDALEICRDRGVRLALITNNVRPLRESPDSGWLFELFDTVIESCVVATRKPEPEIYELALGRLGSRAEETVMLDDLGINLKTARGLGLQTIKVVEPKDAARQLLDLLSISAVRRSG
jgi:putative hydrolase of the HAD superfamily